MQTSANAPPAVNIGALRHQIQIQQQSGAADTFGQPALTWTTVRTPWGGLNVVSMREAFGEGQLTAQETDIWTVRWTSVPIQPGMQVIFNGQAWRIQVVNDVAKRHVVLHLLCLLLNASS